MTDTVSKLHYQTRAKVIAKESLGADICKITVRSPEISCMAIAGQFVMVQASGANSKDPLLRRPFSIHQVTSDTFSILFKVLGRGTEILSAVQISDELDFVGPLGNGFTVTEGAVHYLVGGGMGIAPLLFLAQQLRQNDSGAKVVALIGARNKAELVALDELGGVVGGLELQVATDDGSFGQHGLVTNLLSDVSMKGQVYCCGPWPMMKAVAAICREKELSCQVSLETMMACGVGACLGCAVEGAPGLSGSNYLHVCKDGPVYEAVKVWG